MLWKLGQTVGTSEEKEGGKTLSHARTCSVVLMGYLSLVNLFVFLHLTANLAVLGLVQVAVNTSVPSILIAEEVKSSLITQTHIFQREVTY